MKRNNDNTGWLLPFLAFCLLIYMLLCMAGCATHQRLYDLQTDSIRTVINNKIIYQDTVILVPIPAESDRSVLLSADTSRLKTSLAESEVYVADGRLHHSLRNKSEYLQPISVKMPSLLKQTEHYIIQKKIEFVEVERELTDWEKLILSLGLGAFVSVCAAMLYIIIRVVRRFI